MWTLSLLFYFVGVVAELPVLCIDLLLREAALLSPSQISRYYSLVFIPYALSFPLGLLVDPLRARAVFLLPILLVLQGCILFVYDSYTHSGTLSFAIVVLLGIALSTAQSTANVILDGLAVAAGAASRGKSIANSPSATSDAPLSRSTTRRDSMYGATAPSGINAPPSSPSLPPRGVDCEGGDSVSPSPPPSQSHAQSQQHPSTATSSTPAHAAVQSSALLSRSLASLTASLCVQRLLAGVECVDVVRLCGVVSGMVGVGSVLVAVLQFRCRTKGSAEGGERVAVSERKDGVEGSGVVKSSVVEGRRVGAESGAPAVTRALPAPAGAGGVGDVPRDEGMVEESAASSASFSDASASRPGGVVSERACGLVGKVPTPLSVISRGVVRITTSICSFIRAEWVWLMRVVGVVCALFVVGIPPTSSVAVESFLVDRPSLWASSHPHGWEDGEGRLSNASASSTPTPSRHDIVSGPLPSPPQPSDGVPSASPSSSSYTSHTLRTLSLVTHPTRKALPHLLTSRPMDVLHSSLSPSLPAFTTPTTTPTSTSRPLTAPSPVAYLPDSSVATAAVAGLLGAAVGAALAAVAVRLCVMVRRRAVGWVVQQCGKEGGLPCSEGNDDNVARGVGSIVGSGGTTVTPHYSTVADGVGGVEGVSTRRRGGVVFMFVRWAVKVTGGCGEGRCTAGGGVSVGVRIGLLVLLGALVDGCGRAVWVGLVSLSGKPLDATDVVGVGAGVSGAHMLRPVTPSPSLSSLHLPPTPTPSFAVLTPPSPSSPSPSSPSANVSVASPLSQTLRTHTTISPFTHGPSHAVLHTSTPSLTGAPSPSTAGTTTVTLPFVGVVEVTLTLLYSLACFAQGLLSRVGGLPFYVVAAMAAAGDANGGGFRRCRRGGCGRRCASLAASREPNGSAVGLIHTDEAAHIPLDNEREFPPSKAVERAAPSESRSSRPLLHTLPAAPFPSDFRQRPQGSFGGAGGAGEDGNGGLRSRVTRAHRGEGVESGREGAQSVETGGCACSPPMEPLRTAHGLHVSAHDANNGICCDCDAADARCIHPAARFALISSVRHLSAFVEGAIASSSEAALRVGSPYDPSGALSWSQLPLYIAICAAACVPAGVVGCLTSSLWPRWVGRRR